MVGADRQASLQASLLARARAGDRQAFEAIVGQYEASVYGYVCRLLGSVGGAGGAEHAHHLTRDVFLRAYRALPNAPEDAGVWVWLCRIATDVCLAAQRWRTRVRRHPLAFLASALHPRLSRAIPRTHPMGPHLRAPRAEGPVGPDELQSILAGMRPKYRGFSYEEIAEVLSVSRAAVRSLVFRAREEFGRVRAGVERSPARAA
jgi:RNA polymerase sigma-70 factor (ECF subfamily)